MAVEAVDGTPVASGLVVEETQPQSLKIAAHFENLSFDQISSPCYPIILGITWLTRHNPYINWAAKTLFFGCEFCTIHCQCINPPSEVQEYHLDNLPQSIAQLEAIPEEYQEFSDVFQESTIKVLPPHRPFDCTIDIYPDAIVPYWQIISLSPLELEALGEYLDANLENGLIVPSKSPAGDSLFLYQRKEHLNSDPAQTIEGLIW